MPCTINNSSDKFQTNNLRLILSQKAIVTKFLIIFWVELNKQNEGHINILSDLVNQCNDLLSYEVESSISVSFLG